MARILGVYDQPGKTAAAIQQIRGRGYTDILTYAPAPFAEVEPALWATEPEAVYGRRPARRKRARR